MAGLPEHTSRYVALAQRGFVGIAFVVLVVYLVPEVQASRDPFHWDLMFATGVVTLIAGLLAAEGFERRVASTIGRLVDRKVVDLGDQDPYDFLREVRDRAERTGLWAGAALGLVMLAGSVGAAGDHRVALHFLMLVGGFFGGYHLGRFASYGRIGKDLSQREDAVKPLLHHPDGVAGLRPVGELYFSQAKLAAVPALFLAAWSFVLPAWPASSPHDYSEWRWWYLAFLAIALGGMAFAFLWPMRSFHRIMVDCKARLVKAADMASQEIAEIKAKLAREADDDRRKLLAERLRGIQEDYAAIESMPTWPIDPDTRRRYLNRNLALTLLPVVGNVAGLSDGWKGLLAGLVGA